MLTNNELDALNDRLKKLENENFALQQKLNTKQSFERFKLLSNLTFEGIFIHNNGICIEANQSYYNMTGYSRDELIGKNLIDLLVFDESKPLLYQNMQIDYAKPYRIKVKNRDGSVYIVEIESKKFNYGGDTLRVTAVRDISERIQAEENYKKSEELYRVLTENMKDVVWILDTQTLQYTYVSPSIKELRGYTAEEVMALPAEHALTPEAKDSILQLIQQRVSDFLNGNVPKNKFYTDVIEQPCKNGQNAWTELITYLYLNEETKHIEIRGVTRNITDRKKAEEALIESEEKYKVAFKTSPDSITINKLNGIYIDINEGFTKLTGYTREDVIGVSSKDIDIWAVPEDREKLLAGLKTNGVVENLETQFRYKDGTIITGLMSARIININNEPHILSITRDISYRKDIENKLRAAKEKAENSEQLLKKQNKEYETINEELQETNLELIKAKEKAEESDRLKTAFLCNMSHEIRTPMNAIIGFTDFLLNPEITIQKQQRFASMVKERTYDLLRIIEDILDISKIEVGQMNIHENEGNMAEMLHELNEYYILKRNNDKTKASIEIKCVFDIGLNVLKVKTDHQRVKQILNNLIDNAFKFTKEGFIEFGCKLLSETELLFYVKDTGTGIPANKLDIIFDRFRQAEESHLSRKQGGTGLGLSIAKGLLELLHGKIWVESKENVGTTFFFTIPLIYTSDTSTINTNVKHEQKQFFTSHKKVLIVEDDYANLIYLLEVLSDSGLNLVTATTGEQAMELFNENPDTSLILMDIRLPDTNGLQLTRKIKQLNPAVIVIAQTAYAAPNDLEDCLKAGCNDYISKPINYKNLISLISKYI